jgi:hypothetical protein
MPTRGRRGRAAAGPTLGGVLTTSSSEVPVIKLLDKIADAGGILYVALVVPGYVLLVAPFMPASLDSPVAVVAHLEAHPPTAALWAGMWMEGAGLLALVLLTGRLASRVGAARPTWWLPSAALGLAVAAFAVKIGSFAPGIAALDVDRYDPSTVTALLGINDAAADVTGVLDGASALLVGLGMLAVRALPRWLAASTVLAGAALVLGAAMPLLAGLELLFFVWLLVVSGWLLVRGDRHLATARPVETTPAAV